MLTDIDALIGVVDHGDRRQRTRWLGGIVASVLGNFGLVYTLIIALQQQAAGRSYAREVLMYGLAVVVWYVASRRVWSWTGAGLTRGVHALTDRLIARLRRLPLDRFEAHDRDALIDRLTSDTQRVVNSAPALIGAPLAVVRLGIGVVFAFWVAPDVALVTAAAMVLVGLAIAAQLQAMGRGFGVIAGAEVQLFALLRGHVAGAIPIKLHGPRALAILDALHTISDDLRARRAELFTVFFERQHAANAVIYGVLGVNVFLLPLLTGADNQVIREINLVLVWAVFSVFGILFTVPELGRASDALGRLRDLDNALSDDVLEPPVEPGRVDGARFAGFQSLTVSGLRFGYPSTPERPGFELGPIDVTLRPRELVFVTGFNGSGKSTFLKALTGLYPARNGEIAVDGEVIGPDDLADYRALFSTIFTDHHLFEKAYGVPAEAVGRAQPLLAEMEIDHVTDIVDGRVTRRELSTGQKKRLALVLARLQARPVLILDEWAADQDPEYRRLFYERILPALRDAGRLVVAVTHDDQYFHCADRALHFDGGRLVDAPPRPTSR